MSKFFVARLADFGVAYTFPDLVDFTGYTGLLNVYTDQGGSVLLTFGTAATANGSVVTFSGNVAAFNIDASDVDALPDNDDDVSTLWFDFVVISPGGEEKKLDGGPFIVQPVGAKPRSNPSELTVSLGSETYQIAVSFDPTALLSVEAAEAAAARSETAATASETATEAAQQHASSAQQSMQTASEKAEAAIAAAQRAANSAANADTTATGNVKFNIEQVLLEEEQARARQNIGLGSVDNTADTAKPVSTAQQAALDLKANRDSPTFTGTVSGITKSMVGLGSVDNTADTAKPVSTAQQAALDLKANLNSPALTGTPTTPTPSTISNDTTVASTAYATSRALATAQFYGLGASVSVLPPTVVDANTMNSGNVGMGLYRVSGTSLNVNGVASGNLIHMDIQSGRGSQFLFNAATGAAFLRSSTSLSTATWLQVVTSPFSSPLLLNTTTPSSNRSVIWQTNSVNRWRLRASSDAESGSNAGSNFAIDAYQDDGVSFSSVLTITRSTGAFGFLATPTAPTATAGDNSTKLATTAFVTTALSSFSSGLVIKQAVKAVATSNNTLSGPQTIDGVSVVASDRVLVVGQTTVSQNGVYVAAAGSWTRATDFDAWSEILGAMVSVSSGTAYGGTLWLCTATSGGTVGTNDIPFNRVNLSAYGGDGAVTVSGSTIGLSDTGVSAGTYRRCTVDAKGRVTAGSNTTFAVSEGGTGATTAADARDNLGLGSAATYDTANLPVSNATQNALDLKMALNGSTAMTGNFTCGSSSGGTRTINLDSATTSAVSVRWMYGGAEAWHLLRDPNNNFYLSRRNTADGTQLDIPFTISGTTGVFTLGKTPVWDTTNASYVSAQAVTVGSVHSLWQSQRIYDAKLYGCACNGSTDDAPALQALIDLCVATGDYCTIVWEGTLRLNSTINVSDSIRLSGFGTEPRRSGTSSKGSWLRFAHLDKGLNIFKSGGAIVGCVLDGFGTMRDQASPGTGWSPAAADFDIYIKNQDVLIPNLTILNATKGIHIDNDSPSTASWSRLQIGNLRGQAFQTMLDVESCTDVVRIDNLHFWPFWSSNTNVVNYMIANCDVIKLGRCDNPIFGNIFSIYARSTFRFSQNAQGLTAKCKISNLDSDLGSKAIWVDSTVSQTSPYGVSVQVGNLSHQAQPSVAGTIALHTEGNGAHIAVSNFRSDYAFTNAIRLYGTGNRVEIGTSLIIRNHNQGASGFPAIEVNTGNSFNAYCVPSIAAAPTTGGSGTIRALPATALTAF